MYYRISGAPFTVKNADEKKELIEAINADSNYSKHLVCRGIDAEQFTGKLNSVVVVEKENPNKVYIFTCEGNFPTLKLYQRSSAVIYIIEVPVSKDGQTVVEKKEEIETPPKEEPEVAPIEKVEEEKKPEEDEIKPVDVDEGIPAAEFVEEPNPFENPLFSEDEPEVKPEAEEQPVEHVEKPKKRGRRKKS